MARLNCLKTVMYILQICSAPKPPLCKGRWHGGAVTEGLCSKINVFALVFGEIATYFCDNPSVMLFA